MSHIPDRQRLFIDSDNYIVLEGLLNTLTDEYPTDATVTVTLYDRYGTAVTGAEDLPLTYVTGTADELTQYRAILQDTLTIAPGQYNAKVTASKDGVVRVFNVPITFERG